MLVIFSISVFFVFFISQIAFTFSENTRSVHLTVHLTMLNITRIILMMMMIKLKNKDNDYGGYYFIGFSFEVLCDVLSHCKVLNLVMHAGVAKDWISSSN